MTFTSYRLPVTGYGFKRRRQAGSMTEALQLPWIFLYAWGGWLWGDVFGWPWPGAIAGFVAGMVVGVMAGAAGMFVISLSAPFIAIASWILVPRPWLPHAAAAICALPFASYLFLAARDKAREARGRRIVAGADTPEALLPHLASGQDEVRSAALARLARLGLSPDERARLVVQVAERLKHDSTADRLWLTTLVRPLAYATPAPRDALLLLYEHLGWASSGVAPHPDNPDDLIQRVLFDGLPHDDGSLLRQASETRIRNGWNVDRMVTRLLGTDGESGMRMAGEAFSTGALSAPVLLRLDETRAAAVIEREITRAASTKIGEYDRIIEAALGLPPGRAFPLLERALEWDPADYCIERGFERGLMKDAQPTLAERCAAARAEAASFLAAVRARIARLERYDWQAKFNPGWHPQARLEMWSALAGELETHLE
jgi:hypothetical protein